MPQASLLKLTDAFQPVFSALRPSMTVRGKSLVKGQCRLEQPIIDHYCGAQAHEAALLRVIPSSMVRLRRLIILLSSHG